MSNPNYNREAKSIGYNSQPRSVECVAVEAYPVASYTPPDQPASVDVPSFQDGSYPTSMKPFSLLRLSIRNLIPTQLLIT
jgi:hypothetical protein